MSVINVQNWSVEQVADWVSGLDANLSPYSKDFTIHKVDGSRLLNSMAGDLIKYGVSKIGDQLLLHDAIQSLRSELDSDRVTLQSLSMNLAVRCKNYRSELTRTSKKFVASGGKNYIPTESLASACFLMDCAKDLIRWLTRFPFLGTLEYDDITKKLIKHCFELAMLSQRDSFADNLIEEVQYLCTKIIEICEHIIHSKDSLVIQPSAVDVITLRKRHEQDLGLHVESSYFGLHQVSGVKLSSPAQQSGHLERGDEILQVNYQTVVGWVQQNLISLLHENSNEVILTVKRRPRHATNMLGQMYLRPKIPSRKKTIVAISPIHEASSDIGGDTEETDTSDTTASRSTPEAVTTIVVLPPTTTTTTTTSATAIESSAEATSIQSPSGSSSSSSHAETRFWKLYPRPRNLIKRRATVTGASPTSTRPPVTFVEDDEDGIVHLKTRPPLDKSRSAPGKMLKKQDKVDYPLISVPGFRSTVPTSVFENVFLDDNLLCAEVSTSASSLHSHASTIPACVIVPVPAPRSFAKTKSDIQVSVQMESPVTVVIKETDGSDQPALLSPVLGISPSQTTVLKQSSPSPKFPLNSPSPKYPLSSPSSSKFSPISSLSSKYSPVSSVGSPKFSPVTSLSSKFSPLLTSSPKFFPTTPSPSGSQPSSIRASSVPRVVVHEGILHLRQPQWKFGPRWTRFKASYNSDEKKLQVGHEPNVQLSTVLSDSNVVNLATEVHSRPFAFKVENLTDKSVTYLAAESQTELETWLNLLTDGRSPVETGRKTGAAIPYRRSMSLGNSPRRMDCFGYPHQQQQQGSTSLIHQGILRRGSVPHKKFEHPPFVTAARTARVRNEWLHMKSQSTSKLDDEFSGTRRSSITSGNLSTSDASSTSPSEKKSNISSITITSMKRNFQDPRKVLRKSSSIGEPYEAKSLSCSFEMNLDRGNHTHGMSPSTVARIGYASGPSGSGGRGSKVDASSSPVRRLSCKETTVPQPTMGISMLRQSSIQSPVRRTSSSSIDFSNSNSSTKQNESNDGTPSLSSCPSCGWSPVHTHTHPSVSTPNTTIQNVSTDASTQTDSSILVLLEGAGSESRV